MWGCPQGGSGAGRRAGWSTRWRGPAIPAPCPGRRPGPGRWWPRWRAGRAGRSFQSQSRRLWRGIRGTAIRGFQIGSEISPFNTPRGRWGCLPGGSGAGHTAGWSTRSRGRATPGLCAGSALRSSAWVASVGERAVSLPLPRWVFMGLKQRPIEDFVSVPVNPNFGVHHAWILFVRLTHTVGETRDPGWGSLRCRPYLPGAGRSFVTLDKTPIHAV
jgi:hypothetical protein